MPYSQAMYKLDITVRDEDQKFNGKKPESVSIKQQLSVSDKSTNGANTLQYAGTSGQSHRSVTVKLLCFYF